MPPVIVLITFYSRGGTTETLASAAAVGAVQRRGNIRLRRVPDVNAAKTLQEFPNHKETLVRMHKEYVPPTETDVIGADAIVLVPPAGFDASSAEWADYLRVLAKLGGEGKLAGKVGAVVDAGNESTRRAFTSAIERLGLTIADGGPAQGDAIERAREHGRRVVDLARAREIANP